MLESEMQDSGIRHWASGIGHRASDEKEEWLVARGERRGAREDGTWENGIPILRSQRLHMA